MAVAYLMIHWFLALHIPQGIEYRQLVMKNGPGDILARLSGGHSYNKNLKIIGGVPHESPIFGFAHTWGQEDKPLWYSSGSLKFGGGRCSEEAQCSREDMGGEQEREESHQNEYVVHWIHVVVIESINHCGIPMLGHLVFILSISLCWAQSSWPTSSGEGGANMWWEQWRMSSTSTNTQLILIQTLLPCTGSTLHLDQWFTLDLVSETAKKK